MINEPKITNEAGPQSGKAHPGAPNFLKIYLALAGLRPCLVSEYVSYPWKYT